MSGLLEVLLGLVGVGGGSALLGGGYRAWAARQQRLDAKHILCQGIFSHVSYPAARKGRKDIGLIGTPEELEKVRTTMIHFQNQPTIFVIVGKIRVRLAPGTPVRIVGRGKRSYKVQAVPEP